MIEELRAKGYTASEIVNFLVLGCVIEHKPSEPTVHQEKNSLSGAEIEKEIHRTSEPCKSVKGKSFSPTIDEINRGKNLFRQRRAASAADTFLGTSSAQADIAPTKTTYCKQESENKSKTSEAD